MNRLIKRLFVASALLASLTVLTGCVSEYVAEQRTRAALDNYRQEIAVIEGERADLTDEHEVTSLVYNQRIRRLAGRAATVTIARDESLARIEQDRRRMEGIESLLWTIGGGLVTGTGVGGFLLSRVRQVRAEGEQGWFDTIHAYAGVVEEAREKFPDFDEQFRGAAGQFIKERLSVRDPDAQAEITAARAARKAGA